MSDATGPIPSPKTVEAFLVWPGDGSGGHYELVDGVVRAMAPGSVTHGIIQSNLAIIIGSHLRRHRPGCRVVTTPGVIPRIASDRNFRIPDLGVTCAPDQPKQLSIPDPLVLIEVLSPSNEADTWGNVWAYSTIPSLREILVVHSTRVEVQHAGRSPDGFWPELIEPLGAEEDIRLASLGFSCALLEPYAGTHLAPVA